MKFSVVVMRKIPMIAMGLAASLLAVACGKATFEKQDIVATNIASQYTKPKIDILFVQDTSSSMSKPANGNLSIIEQIKPQLDAFLNGIDSRWDFHFTVVPLHKKLPLTSKWIIAQDCSTISSQYCLNPSEKSYFNNAPSETEYAWINTEGNATNIDQGFTKIKENLSDPAMTSTNFLRADAALAVVVLSNGEDISGMSYPSDYKDRGDGQLIPDWDSANATISFNDFKTYMQSIKTAAGLAKFYAAVASNNDQNCFGLSAWQGSRYIKMASVSAGGIGGAAFNLCDSTALASVLTNIRAQLDALIQTFIFNYAILNDAPIPSTIVVKKNGVIIPESSTNGWSYIGYDTKYMSYSPSLSNQRTGYFIKMNGSAEYSGADIITIEYQKP